MTKRRSGVPLGSRDTPGSVHLLRGVAAGDGISAGVGVGARMVVGVEVGVDVGDLREPGVPAVPGLARDWMPHLVKAAACSRPRSHAPAGERGQAGLQGN
jgi:hypothetical protein